MAGTAAAADAGTPLADADAAAGAVAAALARVGEEDARAALEARGPRRETRAEAAKCARDAAARAGIDLDAAAGPPGSSRRILREDIIAENLDFIDGFNEKQDAAELDPTSVLVLLSRQEFARAMSSGLRESADETQPVEDAAEELGHDDIDDSADDDADSDWDWRVHGAVGYVHNQGLCGSCWAHAAIAAVEGRMAIDHARLFQLSAEQLVSCFQPETFGCRGGSFVDVLRSYTPRQALVTEKTWPWLAQSNLACAAGVAENGVVRTQGILLERGPRPRAARVASMVRQQPVASSVRAASRCFQFYARGVLDDAHCADADEASADHAVAIVGFEKLDNPAKSAWIVKNSWGRAWGEDGFVRIKVHPDGQDPAFGIGTLVAAPRAADFGSSCRRDKAKCAGQGLAVNASSVSPYDDGSKSDDAGGHGLARSIIIGSLFGLWIIALLCIGQQLCFKKLRRRRRARPRRRHSLTRASHESLNRLLEEYPDEIDNDDEANDNNGEARPYWSSVI